MVETKTNCGIVDVSFRGVTESIVIPEQRRCRGINLILTPRERLTRRYGISEWVSAEVRYNSRL